MSAPCRREIIIGTDGDSFSSDEDREIVPPAPEEICACVSALRAALDNGGVPLRACDLSAVAATADHLDQLCAWAVEDAAVLAPCDDAAAVLIDAVLCERPHVARAALRVVCLAVRDAGEARRLRCAASARHEGGLLGILSDPLRRRAGVAPLAAAAIEAVEAALTGPLSRPSAESSTGPPAGPPAGPTAGPPAGPTAGPSAEFSAGPSAESSAESSTGPTAGPSAGPTAEFSAGPSAESSAESSTGPTAGPSAGPTAESSTGPPAGPTAEFSAGPSAESSAESSTGPTAEFSAGPSAGPTAEFSAGPSAEFSTESSAWPPGGGDTADALLASGAVGAALVAMQRHAGDAAVQRAVCRLFAAAVDAPREDLSAPPAAALFARAGAAVLDGIVTVAGAAAAGPEVRASAAHVIHRCAAHAEGAEPLLCAGALAFLTRALRGAGRGPEVYAEVVEALADLVPALDPTQRRGVALAVRHALLETAEPFHVALCAALVARMLASPSAHSSIYSPFSDSVSSAAGAEKASGARGQISHAHDDAECGRKTEGKLVLSETIALGSDDTMNFMREISIPQLLCHAADTFGDEDPMLRRAVAEAIRLFTQCRWR